jgi:outer membrane protease
MKNIYTFAVLVSIFFFCFSSALWSDNQYSLSLSTSLGIIYGHSEEIVYKHPGKDDYLSELLWDLKPLVYAGLALDLAKTNPWERWGFFAGLSLKYGLPLKTGIMEDRDWLDDDQDYVTHYSRHDTYSQGALLADLSAGLSFPLSYTLLLKAGVKFSYMYFSWIGLDGYDQYAEAPAFGKTDYKPWHSGLTKNPVSGRVITYKQYWFILAPVLGGEIKLSPLFFLDLYAAATPLIYCVDIDDHLKTQVRYQDYLSWGFALDTGIGFAFVPAEKVEFRLDCGIRYISGSRGDVYTKSTGVPSSGFHLSPEIAGGGYAAFDAGFSAKIRF